MPLNSIAATADFDFTATQDVTTVYDNTATVVFDSVGFNGTGNLTFGSPADGGYGAAGPQFITASGPPPTGTVLGTFNVGNRPDGVAVDPTSHDVWVVNNQDNTVTELSSTGSVLGTFTVGHGPRWRGGGSHQPDVWVANLSGATVTELSSMGSLLGTSNVGNNPRPGGGPHRPDVWVVNQQDYRDGAVLDGQRAGQLQRGKRTLWRGGGSHRKRVGDKRGDGTP